MELWVLCILVLILIFILFIIGLIYSLLYGTNILNTDTQENTIKLQRRSIGIFVLCSLAVIMVTTGINAFMNMTSLTTDFI